MFQLDINIEPEKGWKTEDLFVPPGFHVDAEMTGEDEKPEGEAGDQPFLYPMGVGGMLMNSCVGTNYQPGDPCYEAYWATTRCEVSKLIVLLTFCKPIYLWFKIFANQFTVLSTFCKPGKGY